MSHTLDDVVTDVDAVTISDTPTIEAHAEAAPEADFDADELDLDELDEQPVETPPGFEQFGLSEPIMVSLKKMGYTAPTEVQLRCLPILLENPDERGRDMVALARTGTGKTAAFGIPIIERIDTSVRKPQALILCPTRELCQQVATNLGQIGQTKRVRVLSIYGGDSYRRQFEGLSQGPHIVVATPGRLIDLLDRKAVDFSSIRTLVLDEADEMISIGFREALNQILESFSSREDAEPHCTWLFSATMSPDVKRVQSNYIQDAVMIDARGKEEKPLIRQQYMLTFEEDRIEALKRYLHVNEDFYGLIFCQTKAEVAEVEAELKQEGFKVDSLHGDKVQRDREAVFAAWKKKTVKIVVATDVAARGLDVKGLTHVVNMSLPREDETYVHRIGRTGRAGREGIALSFVWPKKITVMKVIERKLKVQLEHIPVPEPEDIARVVLGREIKSLFANPVAYLEGNPIHQMVSELISETQSFDPAVLPHLAALTAKILEAKSPGLLNRRPIKSLRPERPQRDGDRAPRGGGREFGGPRSDRGGGRSYGGGGGGRRYGGDRFERPERSERNDRYERTERFDRSEGGAGRPARSAGGGKPFGKPTKRPAFAGPRLRDRRDDSTGGGAPPRRRDRQERREFT